MGYENIDSNGVIYNVDYHIHAPDQNQHVLLHKSPFMLDEHTAKKNIALAQKSLLALGDDSKVAVIDEATVLSKRNDLILIAHALNLAGVASLTEILPAAEKPSPADETPSPAAETPSPTEEATEKV